MKEFCAKKNKRWHLSLIVVKSLIKVQWELFDLDNSRHLKTCKSKYLSIVQDGLIKTGIRLLLKKQKYH